MKKIYSGLLNQHIKVYKNFSCRFGLGFLTVMLLASSNSLGQILWSAPVGQAWLTGTNWTGGITPNATDIAEFGTAPTGGVTGVGINMNGATNNGANNQAVGAIDVTSARTVGTLIGNSSTSVNGILTLNSATVNAIGDVVLRNNSNGLLTIQDAQALGDKTMTVALTNPSNNIYIDGSGGIIISSVISGVNKNLTLNGLGTGTLSLTAANTYDGLTTVTANVLQLNKTGGGTLPSTNNIFINGGTLKISSNQVISNFTMNAGTLIIDPGVALTITGSYNVSGGTIFNQGTIKLNGGAISFPGIGVTINNGTAGTMTNLEMASTGNMTQTLPFAITGTLTLTSGIIISTATNLITLNDNASVSGVSNLSYVDGPIKKIGNDAFTFPVGKIIGLATAYVPIGISAPGLITDEFTAEYKRSTAEVYPVINVGINHVSRVDYWTLERTGSTSSIDVTLYWTMESSGNGSASYINLLNELIIAYCDGVNWVSIGGLGTYGTSTPVAGSLTWSGLTNTFGPFSLASTTMSNPLPINLNYLNGFKQGNNNLLNWKVTCTNNPNATMSVERSADGRNYNSITTIFADALRCQQPFDYIDNNTPAGLNYYRLKMVDANGKITYSAPIAILNKETGFDIVNLSPTLVNTKAELNVTAAQKTTMTVVITDVAGKQVQKMVYNLIGGSNKFTVNAAGLSAGTYQITGYTADGKSRTIRFVKQ
jgi:autotransporter-associated beta strand protein